MSHGGSRIARTGLSFLKDHALEKPVRARAGEEEAAMRSELPQSFQILSVSVSHFSLLTCNSDLQHKLREVGGGRREVGGGRRKVGGGRWLTILYVLLQTTGQSAAKCGSETSGCSGVT